jgi:hypothetical protein
MKRIAWVLGPLFAVGIAIGSRHQIFWKVVLPLIPLSVLLAPSLRRRWWVVVLAVLLALGLLPGWIYGL